MNLTVNMRSGKTLTKSLLTNVACLSGDLQFLSKRLFCILHGELQRELTRGHDDQPLWLRTDLGDQALVGVHTITGHHNKQGRKLRLRDHQAWCSQRMLQKVLAVPEDKSS